MTEMKFFKCSHCGNFVGMIEDSGVPMECCGEEMEELKPNTSDGAGEKHVPEVTVKGGIVDVQVGSVPHPMLQEHHIEWIYLQTESGGQRKNLKIDSAPVAKFALTEDEKPFAVYEYCNLHGLWMTKI